MTYPRLPSFSLVSDQETENWNRENRKLIWILENKCNHVMRFKAKKYSVIFLLVHRLLSEPSPHHPIWNFISLSESSLSSSLVFIPIGFILFQHPLLFTYFVVATTLNLFFKNAVVASFFTTWFLNWLPCFSEAALRKKSFEYRLQYYT